MTRQSQSPEGAPAGRSRLDLLTAAALAEIDITCDIAQGAARKGRQLLEEAAAGDDGTTSQS